MPKNARKIEPFEKLPIDRKELLTTGEAAELSHIGASRIARMAREPDCPFAFRGAGSKKILIKRAAFQDFLRNN